MIEKYFKAGIRYKWTAPRPVFGALDGTIVDSVSPTPPMVYDGLDGQLVDPELTSIQNVSSLGLTMRSPIQYVWLDYSLGRTARIPIGPYDVITGPMSGCLITDWTERGVRYVGHVGTVDDRPVENKAVRATFARTMPANARGFNPASVWSFVEIQAKTRSFRRPPDPKIMALVTSSGNFYSILMLGLQPDPQEPAIQLGRDWCVGGIKAVPPLNRDALYLELRKLRDA